MGTIRKPAILGPLTLLPLLLNPVLGEPVINEFLASNTSISPDNCDFDDYSDWLELYNPSDQSVSLDNYFLTDDLDQPLKWPVPGGAVIPPGGFLVFRADGFDAAPGETHIRGYWPWNSTLVTRRYHTSFKLSAEGEAIGLFRTENPSHEVALIPLGSIWKYWDTGTDPGDSWMMPGYVDTDWKAGAAQLGYGDGDEATVLDFGPDSTHKFATAYFRRHFQVADPYRTGNLRFRVLADDSAIIYINGVEVARLRMPEGPASFDDYSGQSGSEGVFDTVEISTGYFRPGDNLLAVEVHQVSGSSSDLSFEAELLASVIDGEVIEVDAIGFGPQMADVSFGRQAATPDSWSFFGEPTPGAPNTTDPLDSRKFAPEIACSLESGFHNGPQSVSLQVSGGAGSIRYTLDGSVPSSGSTLYSGPIQVDSTTILRARAFSSGLIPGPVLTRTLFIDEPADRTLPVASFVADPGTLFDDVIGIYENDAEWAHKGREVPVRVEFFEGNGQPGFAVNAGVRIGGENIYRFAQKPLNIATRGRYGDDVIAYQLFPGEAVGTFARINCRNGGDNWAKAMLRDAFMPSVLEGQVEVDLASYRPCVLYLNGEYWGVYNLRKQFDPVYFASEHGIAEGGYDLVQYAHNEYGTTLLLADTGTVDSYLSFQEFFSSRNMGDPANYAELASRMEIDSFIDYVVVQDFIVNTSWYHNREFWCGRAPGSRWRWNVPDLDRGFNITNLTKSVIDDYVGNYNLFQVLDNNPDFVNRLMQRYAAHLGSTLWPARISDHLDALSSEVDSEMERHIARWKDYGGMASLESRQAELNTIKEFAAGRAPYALSNLQQYLGTYRSMANLTVLKSPEAGGRVRIAGVPMAPEYTSVVSMFANTPFELTAEPAPGFHFAGWSTGSTEPTIEVTLAAATSITANFLPGWETVLPGLIDSDTVLQASGSPYSVSGDLVVAPGANLVVEAGTRLLMPSGKSIEVRGSLQVNGTADNPVEILARDGCGWGNLVFVNTTGSSRLSYLVVRDANLSGRDPVRLKAAISAADADLVLDHVDIRGKAPVFARGGSTVLLDSRIEILFTGDGINIKSGAGRVEDCVFIGSQFVDTDAIDFDNVADGVIRGNRIYAFRGFNSDAIDVGEGCVDLLVAGNRIFNITDKGVSVGQGSTVRIEGNLIVDCGMGVGVKDSGSVAFVDKNTFANNELGIAVYEKNLGGGGGSVVVSNCIISGSADSPLLVDALSSATVRYSLSDTAVLPGTTNLLGDPLFNDRLDYDFSLAPDSPAIDSGDPAHLPDSDGSRTDIGASYVYDPADYPYLIPDVVVINELLSHSHDEAPDWIELFNTTSREIDIGGWYLSDDPDNPQKYRIAPETLLPPNGYIVFWENLHFGAASQDPGRLEPFALSENGDSVSVFGPGDGLRPDYYAVETFGPSATGVTKGRYYKTSTRTYNFVPMELPTPGAPNSLPLTGPVVISEIMYHPVNPDAEYIELVNISNGPVVLFDYEENLPWRITRGVQFSFPAANPLSLPAGERILLVRDYAAFSSIYSPPGGTRVFQWESGALDNGGESLELSSPGDVDSLGVRQFIRVDRVNYEDSSPWPGEADGKGLSLTRIDESAYGNDVANWVAAEPTPGTTSYGKWAAESGLPEGQDRQADNPDGDDFANLVEYILGTDPLTYTRYSPLHLAPTGGGIHLALPDNRPDVRISLQTTNDLSLGTWSEVQLTPGSWEINLDIPGTNPSGNLFYRLVLRLFNQY